MMKKLLAVLALAGMPGCCAVGYHAASPAHPGDADHSAAGFMIGLALDILVVSAAANIASGLETD